MNTVVTARQLSDLVVNGHQFAPHGTPDQFNVQQLADANIVTRSPSKYDGNTYYLNTSGFHIELTTGAIWAPGQWLEECLFPTSAASAA